MKIAQIIATVILGLALPLPLMGQDRARLDTTVRLEPRGTVDLSLVSGRIKVRGWDLPDVSILASTEDGVLRFDATPSRLTLRVESEGGRGRPRGEATYDVSVPRGTRLRLQAVSGSVTASGSQGEIAATTVGGAIDVSGGRRQVTLESVSGSLRASQLSGEFRAQSVSGNVRAENVSGRVEASTISGIIRLTGLRASDIRAETASGDIVYAGRVVTGGTYDFESHSGTIRLTVPSNSAAQFRLEAFSGTVQTDFAAEAGPADGPRKGGRVEFTIGDGRARVMARTFNGRIVVKSDSTSIIRRDSVPIIRRDSAPAIRRDSAPTTRRDSARATRRDSAPVIRKDSAPTIRKDSASTRGTSA
jgi:putative adhesin